MQLADLVPDDSYPTNRHVSASLLLVPTRAQEKSYSAHLQLTYARCQLNELNELNTVRESRGLMVPGAQLP